MDFLNQGLAIDERQRAARIEFVLFALSRLAIFSLVTAAMGWVLRGVLAFLLLTIQHALAV